MTEQNPSSGTFDKLTGKAKEAIGEAVGSTGLAAKGRIQREEGEALQQASRLEADAEAQRRIAEQDYVEDVGRAGQQAAAATRQERARKAELERERAAAERAVDRAVEQREEQVERAGAVREASADAKEGVARAQRQAALEDAHHLEEEAADARDTAAELDRLQAETRD